MSSDPKWARISLVMKEITLFEEEFQVGVTKNSPTSVIVTVYIDAPAEERSVESLFQGEHGPSPQGLCSHLDSIHFWFERVGCSSLSPPWAQVSRHEFTPATRLCVPTSQVEGKWYPEEFALTEYGGLSVEVYDMTENGFLCRLVWMKGTVDSANSHHI